MYGDPIYTASAEALVPLDMEVPREPPPGPRPPLAQLFEDDERHRAALTPAVRVHRYRQCEVAALPSGATTRRSVVGSQRLNGDWHASTARGQVTQAQDLTPQGRDVTPVQPR